MDKLHNAGMKAPQIEDSAKITPKTFVEYVAFVSEMRAKQREYFRTRNADALEQSKRMERALDELNDHLLNGPKLF